jgi:phage shock protein A
MAIFSRLVDLLKANINDMIDKAEDPEKMLKQIIIDMEEQLQKATQGLGQIMASERQAKKQLEAAQADSKLWEERAKTALKAGNEELAKTAVDSKIKADANVAQYQQMHDELEKQVGVVRDQVNMLKQKLEEARARQSMLVARAQVAEARQGVAKAVGGIDSGGAFAKMDKMEKKIMQEEAEADAQFEISGLDAEKNDPFKQLEKDSAADSEMERLKKELGL